MSRGIRRASHGTKRARRTKRLAAVRRRARASARRKGRLGIPRGSVGDLPKFANQIRSLAAPPLSFCLVRAFVPITVPKPPPLPFMTHARTARLLRTRLKLCQPADRYFPTSHRERHIYLGSVILQKRQVTVRAGAKSPARNSE